jgi:ankyrin repeat protein
MGSTRSISTVVRRLLHQQTLAGSAATVEILLDAGADVNAVIGSEMTPLRPACLPGWVERRVAPDEQGGGPKSLIEGFIPVRLQRCSCSCSTENEIDVQGRRPSGIRRFHATNANCDRRRRLGSQCMTG